MRLGGQRRSGNIEDRRGMRGPGFGGGVGLPLARLGLPGIIVMIAILVFFPNAAPLLLGGGAPIAGPQQAGEVGAPSDRAGDFTAAVLGSVEDVWGELYASGAMAHYGVEGAYEPSRLVLFEGSVASACGSAASATGPFYCPADAQVYLDTSFFADMERQLGASGDFAHAYVIAHEVGHHVQNLIGATDIPQRAGSERERNALSVRLELQADCFAGVWGHHAARRDLLSPGDIEEALGAANAIGDDRLQRRAQGYVVPDSFTHGSSEQRVRWFRAGFDSGDPAACDTFEAERL